MVSLRDTGAYFQKDVLFAYENLANELKVVVVAKS